MKMYMVEAEDTGFLDGALKNKGDQFPCTEMQYASAWMKVVKELGEQDPPAAAPAAAKKPELNGAPIAVPGVQGGLGEPSKVNPPVVAPAPAAVIPAAAPAAAPGGSPAGEGSEAL